MFGSNKSGDQDSGGGPPRFRIPNWVWPAVWLLILLWLFFRVPGMVSEFGGEQPIEVPYSFFFEQVESGRVSQVTFEDINVTGRFRLDGDLAAARYKQLRATAHLQLVHDHLVARGGPATHCCPA